jgi:methyl-accepting chemotaxis protein
VKSVKLSVKIIGGFGLILLLMILVMGVYQFSSSNSSSGFTGLINGDVAVLNHAGQTNSFMLQARRDEKDFILRHDLKYLDKHAKSVNGLIDNAEIVQKLEEGLGNAQMAAEAAEIIALAKEYQKNFQGLVAAQERAGLDPNSGLQGEFRSAAGIMNKAMPEHDIDNLLIALLQVRRYEKDFLRTVDDQKKNDGYKGKLNNALAHYEALLNNSSCDPVAKNSQQKALATYTTASGPWMAARTKSERDRLYQAMRTSSHDVEAAINSVRVSGATAMMLDIRKHEKDYLLRGDKEYVENVHKAIAKLHTSIKDAGILQEHVEATNKQLDLYQKAFDGLVAENDRIESAMALMRNAVHKIEPLIEEIHIKASKDTQSSTQQITSQSASMSRLAIIAGIITLLIGMALSFFISRSITGPIKKTVQWLTSGAEQVSAASSQVSSASQDLASGASEQAAAIEETSASMNELSAMTRQNADNASQADLLMGEVSKTIQGTNQSMEEMRESMDEISSASEATSKIIKTIDEIAFQTNLLALNAAVEAARAGEAGAGFAVVADEVRNLAMRATEAAKNTAELIEGTVLKVNSGKEIVAKTTAAFKEVAENSTKVGTLVGEIATASQEQAEGIAQINQAISQMDSVTQRNASTAEESASASEELNAQAESMMDAVKDLKDIVDGGVNSESGSATQPLPGRQTSQLKLTDHTFDG